MKPKVADVDIHAVRLVVFKVADEDKKFVKEVSSVFLFDKNAHIYCAEITPSYWLEHVNDEAILTKAGEALSEDERDALRQPYEAVYEDASGYHHCSAIDKLKSRRVKRVSYQEWLKSNSEDEDFRDSVMKEACEYAQGNSVI